VANELTESLSVRYPAQAVSKRENTSMKTIGRITSKNGAVIPILMGIPIITFMLAYKYIAASEVNRVMMAGASSLAIGFLLSAVLALVGAISVTRAEWTCLRPIGMGAFVAFLIFLVSAIGVQGGSMDKLSSILFVAAMVARIFVEYAIIAFMGSRRDG